MELFTAAAIINFRMDTATEPTGKWFSQVIYTGTSVPITPLINNMIISLR